MSRRPRQSPSLANIVPAPIPIISKTPAITRFIFVVLSIPSVPALSREPYLVDTNPLPRLKLRWEGEHYSGRVTIRNLMSFAALVLALASGGSRRATGGESTMLEGLLSADS